VIVETGCGVDNVAHHELLIYFLGALKFLSGNAAVVKTLAGKQYLTSLSQILASVNSTVGVCYGSYLLIFYPFSSSCACIKSHSWSSKQQLHHQQQHVVETSHHLTSTKDKSWQCGTSFGCHHRDTDQWLPESIFITGTTVALCNVKAIYQRPLLSRKIDFFYWSWMSVNWPHCMH